MSDIVSSACISYLFRVSWELPFLCFSPGAAEALYALCSAVLWFAKAWICMLPAGVGGRWWILGWELV